MESIDREQFAKLGSVLNGEQMALFFQVAQTVSKAKEEEKTAVAPNGVIS